MKTDKNDDAEIKYLEHPVTPAEKKKWMQKGFKIIDIRFSPDYDPTAKSDSEMNVSKMKVDQLKDALDLRQITYTEDDKKPDLVELLQAAIDAE